MARHRIHRGTSLIELLVVIVVLLIGILGVIQVFPGGFGVLRDRAKSAVATQLARTQIESLKSRNEQLAEMILSVSYLFNGANVTIVADPNRISDDTSLAANGILANGDGVDGGGNVLGSWPYLYGSNNSRRIVGEGGRVPAPRAVGADFGGLMVLQFAPIVYNAAYTNFFQVYGNDMVKQFGDPGFRPVRSYEYFLVDADESTGQLLLPQSSAKAMNYRLQMTAWISNGGSTYRRDIIDQAVNVPAGGSGRFAVDLSTLAGLSGGETFLGADEDTIRVARLFDQVANSAAFTVDPYEYVLMDQNLGVLLFNPQGYNFQERRQGNRRIPLVARVSYDVYDWRIIRDEFKMPENDPYQNQLTLGNIKVRGTTEADGRIYQGMPIPISDGNGGTRFVDVILQDVSTGGILLYDPANPVDPTPPPTSSNDFLMVDPARSTFAVDKSAGMVRFVDADRTTPGLQVRMILPGQASSIVVDAKGRTVRALYQARGEWSVQVNKAASLYRQAYGTPTIAQYYVGQTPLPGGGFGPGAATRIYFPRTDIGKKVVIGEIFYTTPSGSRIMRDQDFTITNTPADPNGAYIDITTVDSDALACDFSGGVAVRRVKGASVSVRVLWNPNFFNLTGNQSTNVARLEQWGRTWRRTTVETYLQRGEN